MFNPGDDSFRCLGNDGERKNISLAYDQGAYIAVITVCQGKLDPILRTIEIIPNIRRLSLSQTDGNVSIHWRASDKYSTEVQYRLGSGEWTTLDLIPPGTNNA